MSELMGLRKPLDSKLVDRYKEPRFLKKSTKVKKTNFITSENNSESRKQENTRHRSDSRKKEHSSRTTKYNEL